MANFVIVYSVFLHPEQQHKYKIYAASAKDAVDTFLTIINNNFPTSKIIPIIEEVKLYNKDEDDKMLNGEEEE